MDIGLFIWQTFFVPIKGVICFHLPNFSYSAFLNECSLRDERQLKLIFYQQEIHFWILYDPCKWENVYFYRQIEAIPIQLIHTMYWRGTKGHQGKLLCSSWIVFSFNELLSSTAILRLQISLTAIMRLQIT